MPSVPVKNMAGGRASNTSSLAQLLKSSRIELLYTLFWLDEEGKLQYKDFDVLKQSTEAYRKLSEFPRVICKVNNEAPLIEGAGKEGERSLKILKEKVKAFRTK